jgi:cytochrome c-type biogenesis protein CcmH/NrfG
MSQRAERARRRAAAEVALTGPHAESAGPAAAPRDRLSRHPSLAAAAVAALVYLPSLAGGFLYDDIPILVENRRIQDLAQVRTVLSYEPARPIMGLAWAANYALAGLTPWPYHLVNVAIHAGNAALVAALFVWMARRQAPPGHAPDLGAATLAGCLFAATPMAAETVAYVASRSTALAALFGLAATRMGVALLDGAPRSRLALAAGFLLLALATKEEAAAVPLLLLLLDVCFVARWDVRALRRRAWIHAPLVALPALGLLGRRLLTGAWLPATSVPHGSYLITQWAAFPLYVLRTVVPIDPAFFRGDALASWPPGPATIAWGLVSLVLFVTAVAFRHRRPEWTLGILWLAAGLLPSSSIVPLNEMVVDHRAYLGAAGLLFATARFLWRRGGRPLALAVLILLAARAYHYQWVLAEPVRAWEDAVSRAPRSADARRALADAYAAKGDRRAEAALRGAVALEPRDARSWANLGVLLAQGGRLAEAADALRAAVAADPGDARLHDNLGLVLQALGRKDEAIAAYEAARGALPPLASPRIRLAALLLERGDKARALSLLDEAARLEIDPQDAAALEDLRGRAR